MLKMNKFYILIAWAISCFLFFEVAAHADERDEYTKMSFSQPVQIPGQVLPAGTYVFKLADSEDRTFVQIFNADRTVLYTTVGTIPTSRREPTGDTVVTFAEQDQGTPNVLLKWFYPGRTTGHEFVYPKQERQQLAQERHVDISADQRPLSGD